MSPPLAREIDHLRRRASDLSAELAARAAASATAAQERSILRLIGVDGLDRSGRPLSASTSERYCAPDRDRLAGGILLPLAAATIESALEPREVALEVASGLIDLGSVAAELERPERLAEAEAQATKLLGAALARMDANRTAGREQREVLGCPPEPWFGLGLRAGDAAQAGREIRQLIGGGVDVVAIQMPASWEFAEARRASPVEAGEPQAVARGARGFGRGRRPDGRPKGHAPLPLRLSLPQLDRGPVPAGSQRGLAELRKVADEAAAARGCYASLMTVASAFSAPEQAVVAAFERIDLVAADPIREIVEDSVDPERALADHAFAHRLQARAGCSVVMGAGPLTIGAEIAGGIPADSATRAGRSLALQALGAHLALAGGVPPDRLLLGAVPAWLSAADPCTYLVQSWLRRTLFPRQRLVVEAPLALTQGSGSPDAGWSSSLVAALAGAPAALVIGERSAAGAGTDGAGRQSGPTAGAVQVAAAASAAAALRRSLGDGALHGDALDLAGLTLRAAAATLDRLAAEGWSSVLGPAGAGAPDERFGHAAVVPRSIAAGSASRLLDRLI